ncbi:DEAD/DEAH box helicase [Flavobacterium sp. TAB 87]|uniref:DEAD/DEAH box helicase n=1 Tax=Flavobacterium sp. TAB 87 TaxID=1729581 RepID=UPI00076D6E91|nr:DEAD/DEAH box helicase family protein [Flavobacterium sp. TAB 87]KVV13417.1 Restriction endonuclease [Flavobacterium sp. TAB 87]
MELKSYQQQVITDLDLFLEYLQKHDTPTLAFKQYWEDKVGAYELKLDGNYSGMTPYKDNIKNTPHIAIKVPTAGGKTFIACNAIHSIFSSYESSRPKAIVWLVPWSNLLQQTASNLSDASHPYRQKLNTLFNHSVEVYEKESLLQGANFNPTSVSEQLNISVFNFSSLRINSKKKDDRKIYQQNGALESFRDSIVAQDLVLPDTDETALINIIRSLNPLVIVDESHNAESDLSIEMLQNLNPSFILDLTATPKKNSNIVSYVNAIELKKEHMVKLPVIVYNHSRKEEVINSALHLQRQLEQLAIQESLDGGKKIRPIILFQAQSNIKGSDNTTYIKIKEKLIELKIPEEQIKIKVSGLDELKGIDLMDEKCPVRYIITVNALKEGWDCPFAYILASLADKSSAVEVEQILGRVLRQPYVIKHKEPLLNLSFVLTASAKFNETLDNIVKGLQDAGFSNKDYYAEEIISEEVTTVLTDKEVLSNELFGSTENSTIPSFTDADITNINVGAINFDPTEKTISSTTNTAINLITQKAIEEGKAFETRLTTEDGDNTEYLLREMGKEPKRYKIVEHFNQVAETISLPQFYKKLEESVLNQELVFEELSQGEVFLNRDQLLSTFKLSSKNIEIDFNSVTADVVKVDYDEKRKDTIISKFSIQAKKMLTDTILAKPKEKQVKDITSIMVGKIGNMTPIAEQEIKKYIERIFSEFSTEEIIDAVNNEYNYLYKIKAKIIELANQHAKEEFKKLLDTNKIIVKPSFKFKNTLVHSKEGAMINKSLYEREGDMNNFEQSLIMDVASLDNILFWHRNSESKEKGFYLNGFNNNHYPDFILYTQKGNIVLVETKGDFLDNDDSRAKNILGKKWAEKSGDNYKYFMVFENKNVEGCYTAKNFLEIIGAL